MNFSPDSKLEIPDTTLYQELDGECVLLNLTNEAYFGLNGTGTIMWNTLAESDSIQKAFNKLLNEFVVEEEILSKDFYHFIDELIENQMVQIS